MTATLLPTRETTALEASATTSLWRTGLRAGAIAAVATTAIAAVADAAGVSLAVDGEAIPLLGFAQMTLLGAVIGIVLAKCLARWASHPSATFVRATVAFTAVSVVPDLTMGFDAASAATLILTHVVAAAIVIPRLAERLDR